MPSMLIVTLSLVAVSLTSAQMPETDPPPQGMKCYRCDTNAQGESCLYRPHELDQEKDYVICPAGYQCHFTFYRMKEGPVRFGKRGCTNTPVSLPISIAIHEGCQDGLGYQLCRRSCGLDFCNMDTPGVLSTSYAPRLQLSAWLMGSSMMMTVVTMIYTVLL